MMCIYAVAYMLQYEESPPKPHHSSTPAKVHSLLYQGYFYMSLLFILWSREREPMHNCTSTPILPQIPVNVEV